jgi:hypothetical protein
MFSQNHGGNSKPREKKGLINMMEDSIARLLTIRKIEN